MGTRKSSYALAKDEPKRLELEWTGMFKDVHVRLDGNELGAPIQDFKALKAGAKYQLPDGRTLGIRYNGRRGGGLELDVDGKPLPGTAQDPHAILGMAWGFAALIGAINIAVGLLGMFVFTKALGDQGIGWIQVAVGVVLIGLALAVRQKQMWALVVVALLVVADIVVTVAVMAMMAADSGRTGSVAPVIMKVLFAVPIFKAFGALATIRKEARDPGMMRSR